MSLRKITPCDADGICPYDAEYHRDCEYWCSSESEQYFCEDYENSDEEVNDE